LSASIASRADAVGGDASAPAARDRTRGVDTFRFTKVLSKPTTVSRLEHVVRGRMKRARRGDGRQALVAALVGGARRDLDRAAARSGGSFPGGWF
jgi:hypothetical protein